MGAASIILTLYLAPHPSSIIFCEVVAIYGVVSQPTYFFVIP